MVNLSRRPFQYAVIAALAVLIAGMVWFLFSNELHQRGSARTIRIAVIPHYGSTLLYLAADQGFFEAEGVNAELVLKPLSQAGLDALWRGEVDLTASFEVQLLNAMLAQKHPVILTELYSSSSQTAIVYRHDRGIQSPADLAHHRVGLNVGTNAEFVLDLLLTSNGVRKSSVEIVPMEWKSHRDALLKGLVDAVVTWEPTATEIISEGTVPAAVVSADFYTEINSLVATRKSAIEKTDEIRRVLRALSRAQEFYRNHPAQSREIVSRHLNPRSSSGFSMFWEKMNPHLGLSSVLVTTLKEEMEWMVRNKMASQVVNVYEMLDPSYLKRLSPELVTYE